jgi:hypothetical protein
MPHMRTLSQYLMGLQVLARRRLILITAAMHHQPMVSNHPLPITPILANHRSRLMASTSNHLPLRVLMVKPLLRHNMVNLHHSTSQATHLDQVPQVTIQTGLLLPAFSCTNANSDQNPWCIPQYRPWQCAPHVDHHRG